MYMKNFIACNIKSRKSVPFRICASSHQGIQNLNIGCKALIRMKIEKSQ